MSSSAYQPFAPAQRPGRRPESKPAYRVLVHRKFLNHWASLVDRVGAQQAQQFWDHVSQTPGMKSPIASITILKGTAGLPMGEGWSRTHHFEISGAGRIDYQYHNAFRGGAHGDAHPVVAILTISFGSH